MNWKNPNTKKPHVWFHIHEICASGKTMETDDKWFPGGEKRKKRGVIVQGNGVSFWGDKKWLQQTMKNMNCTL